MISCLIGNLLEYSSFRIEKLRVLIHIQNNFSRTSKTPHLHVPRRCITTPMISVSDSVWVLSLFCCAIVICFFLIHLFTVLCPSIVDKSWCFFYFIVYFLVWWFWSCIQWYLHWALACVIMLFIFMCFVVNYLDNFQFIFHVFSGRFVLSSVGVHY